MLKSIKLQETSVISNSEMKESGAKKVQLDKLKMIYKSNPQGLTDVEASEILKLTPAIVSARRNDLMEECNVAQVGRRKNPSGREAIIWTVLETKSLFGRKETPKQRLNAIIHLVEKWKKDGNLVSAPSVLEAVLSTAKS
jgi:hypothetical protein